MTESIQKARVRFAPSPTGHMHLGSGRTALYNYLIAKQTGGQFILRIEDTDQKRYVPGAEQELMDGMRWLGIDWDEGPDIGGPYGPYRQSERKALYQKYAMQLIESGHAYFCFCTPERLSEVREKQQINKEQLRYDRRCRDIPLEEAMKRVEAGELHVVRFKTPLEGTTTVTDMVRGDIVVENQTLDDYIIVKSDGLALYHLASMVDDYEMKITHVFRGSEWLPTFPLHAMIIRALGWNEPKFVHLSVFLNPSGTGKMSKREALDLQKGGKSIFIKDMQELGYLPDAINNWMALMGWSYDDHTEFFTKDDLIEKFSIKKLNPSPAAINFTKLDHFNGLHIRQLPSDALAELLKPFLVEAGYEVDDDKLLKISPIIQERMKTLDEVVSVAGFFFEDEIVPTIEVLLPKKLSVETTLEIAKYIYDILKELPILNQETVEAPLRDYIETSGYKARDVFGILRSAATGRMVSPPLMETLEIIGKEMVIRRLELSINFLENA
jgi:glutamyl-tRNA synthetase